MSLLFRALQTLRYISSTAILLWLGALTIEPCLALDSGYDIPAYGGPWAAVHRDNRNSNYAPVPVASVYQSDFETTQINQLTFNHPVIGPSIGLNNPGYIYYTFIGAYTNSQGVYARANLFVGKGVGAGKTAVQFGPGIVDSNVTAATALIGSDGSFFLADNESLMKYSPTGQPLWSGPTPIAGIQPSGPQFTPDGKLLLMTWNGWVHVIEPGNGLVLWQANMTPSRSYPAQFPTSCVAAGNSGACAYANTPAIDPNTNMIYQTFNNQAGQTSIQKYRYNIRSHQLTLIAKSGFLAAGSPSSIVLSSDYQTLYVSDNSNHLIAYNVNNLLTPSWTLDIGYSPAGAALVNPNGFIVPNGAFGDPNFKLMVVRDVGSGGQIVFEDNQYIPISSPAGGLNDRFVAVACQKDSAGQPGTLGLVVFDPNGIISFTPWKDQCLGASVIPSLGVDGSVYVVGSGSVGLKKFSPVSP